MNNGFRIYSGVSSPYVSSTTTFAYELIGGENAIGPNYNGNFGFFYDGVGPSNIGMTYGEISWNTLKLSRGSDISLSSTKILVNKTATYEINLDVSYKNDTGFKQMLETIISIDGIPTPLENSAVYSYHRNSDQGITTVHTTYIGNFTNLDEIRIWVRNPITDNSGCSLVQNGTRISVKTL